MDSGGYIALSRQAGLAREMQAVASNIATISTTGFRREGMIFAEMMEAAPVEGGAIAMTAARVRFTAPAQGGLTQTGAPFDLAIEGDGFLMVETPAGLRLTRAGAFSPNAEGELVNGLGHRLLDAGEAAVLVPPGAAIAVAPDGTMTADGQPLAQIGIVDVSIPDALFREDGVVFRPDAPLVPVANPGIKQGFLEGSNVNAVVEIARMIEVQRSYEAGQALQEREDERMSTATRTLGRTPQ